MDKVSVFIENKAAFGGFPKQEDVEILESNNVKYFVNLTHSNEKNIYPYNTKYVYIEYPIKDGEVPEDKYSFSKFIYNLCDIIENLKDKEMIYIHCRGGHGRSGLVVACLLCKLYDFSIEKSLKYTSDIHNKRENMKDYWRKIGSPQTKQQKQFVYNMCRTTYLNNSYFLNVKNIIEIKIKKIGEFTSIYEAVNYINTTKNVDLYIITKYVIELLFKQNKNSIMYLEKTHLKNLKYLNKYKNNEKITEVIVKYLLDKRKEIYLKQTV